MKPGGINGAGVGHQEDFRPLEHQHPGTFRKFPVIADHNPQLYPVKSANAESVPRFQQRFHGKSTGMHLVVAQQDLPAAANDQGRVAGRGVTGAQAGDTYPDTTGAGRFPEGGDIDAVKRHGLFPPAAALLFPVGPEGIVPRLFKRGSIGIGPHFREQNQVGTLGLGLLNVPDTPADIFLRFSGGCFLLD